MIQNYLDFENNNNLINICEKHDIVKLSKFIKFSKNLKNVNVGNCFYVACTHESTQKNEFIELFINTKQLRKKLDVSNICSNMIIVNNLELFKKLSNLISVNESLLSNYLNLSIENNNIDFFKHLIEKYKVDSFLINKCFIKACEFGQLKIVEYLSLNHNVDIHFNNDLAIRRAVNNNHINIVKYLL